jgi:hypothetical protein
MPCAAPCHLTLYLTGLCLSLEMGTRDFTWLWNTTLGGDTSEPVHVMKVGFETTKNIPKTTMQKGNAISEIDNSFMNAVFKKNNEDSAMHTTRAFECKHVRDNEFEVFFVGDKIGGMDQLSVEDWGKTALSLIENSSIGTQKQWIHYVKTIQNTAFN